MEQLPEETHDSERLREGLARMRAICGADAPVELTITNRFEETVNEIQGTSDYRQDRGMGMTLAKVFTREDASFQVVIWAGLFERDFDSEQALITLEHEALHVAISLRGESLNTVRIQRGIRDDTARGHFVALAGIAIEEGRVERALADRHSGRAASQETTFARAVPNFYETLRAASIEYQETLDVAVIARRTLAAFEFMLNYSAYMAATAGDDELLERYAFADDVCLKVLGEPWVVAMRTITDVPTAEQEFSAEDRDAAVDASAAAIENWMNHVGFGCEDAGQGPFYFHVLNPDEWVDEPAVEDLYEGQA